MVDTEEVDLPSYLIALLYLKQFKIGLRISNKAKQQKRDEKKSNKMKKEKHTINKL